MRCTQPGCTGTIEDGYCNVCGLPPGETAAPPVTFVAPSVGPADVVAAPQASSAPPPAPAAAGPFAASSRPSVGPFATPAVSASASTPVGERVPPTASTIPAGGARCQQPGCAGTIVDGYCDTCGMSADAPPPAPAPEPVRTSESLTATALGTLRAEATTGAPGTRRSRAASARLRAARLGVGLTSVPPAPPVDPATALMPNPEVPENKRTCPKCGAAVGRSHDGQPGRTDGYCPQCGTRFSFTPKLAPGDLVAGQYEVKGALAHGGMGWIYLAQDHNVSDRYVVLKGLLNSADADQLASAIGESRWLAQLQHPLIVEIYNFVTHDGDGYIVMEYVGGKTMKQVLQARMAANHGRYDPLPVDQALALIIEVLPAFQYLHDQGLVYCDFKPDNLVQVGDSVKLIDLGGVRRIDDADSAIFGTVGYQAPEVAQDGASVASDLYTVGRAIVVLCAEFRGYQSTYEFSLPSPDEMPLFAQQDSLYRLLLKCCAPDPNDRFVSADDLRNQLLGVLREVVAAKTPGASQSSSPSLLFTAPTFVGDGFAWRELPDLRPDALDPLYDTVQAVMSDPAETRLRELAQIPDPTAEVGLARCHAALELGDVDQVGQIVDDMLRADPWEWRAVWMAGVAALVREDWAAAQSAFNAVYGQVPGELAAKLALAYACERAGESDVAETLYSVCASTDSNYVIPAGFGLARIRAARRDLPGALAALDIIPPTSRGYSESRRLRAAHLIALGSGLADLDVAMRTVDDARLDPAARAESRVRIWRNALTEVKMHGDHPEARVGGVPAAQKPLRIALEGAYRELAAVTTDPAERASFVDAANATRKWSLL